MSRGLQDLDDRLEHATRTASVQQRRERAYDDHANNDSSDVDRSGCSPVVVPQPVRPSPVPIAMAASGPFWSTSVVSKVV